jgi:chromate reductase
MPRSMSDQIKVLAISGSTREKSSNLYLIRAIREMGSALFAMKLFDGLSAIPHFNPDLDNENPPVEVAYFRRQLKEADGILICTPEYAMGVPGTLKNAIDWTVSSMEFSGKPVALITASLSGEKGHASLLGTLLVIESQITDDTQLIIPFVKTKINDSSTITDAETSKKVVHLIQSFVELIKRQKTAQLSIPEPIGE